MTSFVWTTSTGVASSGQPQPEAEADQQEGEFADLGKTSRHDHALTERYAERLHHDRHVVARDRPVARFLAFGEE